ncbi:hypothetical protein MSG28_015052 [Choristoneura fumiferana]|uniref:Uncharacterized protein n=1 Tax=Choristoneura fumiferana TaxID=7141 RepID=A0ACC0KZ28_CHOFU|nr:hypothetical protein MSG28_015052 [Choristoneura fumiferana]
MCGLTFEIYHELCGEGKHREETCTNLRSNSMVRVKFPIRTGPAWELWPKPSCTERRPVPSSGTYIGWGDDTIMSKLGYLRMLGYGVTLVMHIGNLVYVRMNMTEEALGDKRFLQMIYAVLGLSCEILLLRNAANKNYKLPKHLKGCRDTIFSALLWPVTLLVFTVFWTLFFYDRSLIFPDFIDKVLTPVSNHIMHTAIVPVVLWEILLQPRYEPKSHMKNIAHLIVYMLVYLSV